LCRLFAIKTDQLNLPVRGQKAIEIIARSSFQIYVRVHAARSRGFQEYVPECDAMIDERGTALLIDSFSRNKVTHYSPKNILRMCIVLTRLQRPFPRQAAKNQDACIMPRNWWKAN
jgi:hypothetical protein